MAAFFAILHSLRACTARFSVVARAVDGTPEKGDEWVNNRRTIKSRELQMRGLCARYQGCAASWVGTATKSSQEFRLPESLQHMLDEINKLDEILGGCGLGDDERRWKVLLHRLDSEKVPSSQSEVDLLHSFMTKILLPSDVNAHLQNLEHHVEYYEFETRLSHGSLAPVDRYQRQRWDQMSTDLLKAWNEQQTLLLCPPADLQSQWSFLRYRIRRFSAIVITEGSSSRSRYSVACCDFEPSAWLKRHTARSKWRLSPALNTPSKNLSLTEDMRSQLREIEKQRDSDLQYQERLESLDRRIETAFFMVMALTVSQCSQDIIDSLDTGQIKYLSGDNVEYDTPILIREVEEHRRPKDWSRFLVIGVSLAELALAQPIEVASEQNDGEKGGTEFVLTRGANPESRVRAYELVLMVRVATSVQYSDAVRHCLEMSEVAESTEDLEDALAIQQTFVEGVFFPLSDHYRVFRDRRDGSVGRESAELPRLLQKRNSQVSARSWASVL